MDKLKKIKEIIEKSEELFMDSDLSNLEIIGILEQLKYSLLK